MLTWTKEAQVPPRFELGSLDSESRVLTITPWNQYTYTYLDNPVLISQSHFVNDRQSDIY